jgi:hypothetical protein
VAMESGGSGYGGGGGNNGAGDGSGPGGGPLEQSTVMNWYELQGHFGLVTPLISINDVLMLHECIDQCYNAISAK